jgi:hypothetical protein
MTNQEKQDILGGVAVFGGVAFLMYFITTEIGKVIN